MMRPVLPRLRPLVAAVTASALSAALPVTAHAEESASSAAAPAPLVAPVAERTVVMTHVVPVLPLDVSRAALLAPSSSVLAGAPTSLALFAPAPRDIRLSHGAKVAIIVTAIVVGSLIVLGVVIASRPGHPL